MPIAMPTAQQSALDLAGASFGFGVVEPRSGVLKHLWDAAFRSARFPGPSTHREVQAAIRAARADGRTGAEIEAVYERAWNMALAARGAQRPQRTTAGLGFVTSHKGVPLTVTAGVASYTDPCTRERVAVGQGAGGQREAEARIEAALARCR